jgi:hypothetical protein
MAALQRAEDIAAELLARLATVLTAGGFETDAGTAVFAGRSAKQIDRTNVPCTVLIEADDVPDRQSVGLDYQIEQRYVLMAFVPCDPDNPNEAAHKALRDLKRAVFLTDGKPDPRWGRRVKDVTYIGRDIAPRDDGEAFVLALMEISVTYAENLGNP